MTMINKQIASEYMKQLELISIIFFVIRDNKHYFSPKERLRHKHCLKAAQRYLLILQGSRKEYPRHGTLPATEYSLSYWQTRKDAIIATRLVHLRKYLVSNEQQHQ